ncbi:hypothetical protein DID80_01465 [Candidatus Marinamargulisbacteria bacterium SCGC AAA071-K20]|nr:hypothetical protein DID80_01465 [Candidatus Marinamargulisbacteria bacterium SCGC AAA071-K20]
MITKEDVLEKLKTIINPSTKETLVDSGLIKNCEINNDTLTLRLDLPKHLEQQQTQFKALIKHTLSELNDITLNIQVNIQPEDNIITNAHQNHLEGIKNIIAVSSCKGGVGKSTVSVNLAYTLKELGAKVGLFDADLYGPSLPTMVNRHTPLAIDDHQVQPIIHEDVKLMSFGFTQDEHNAGPAILRGPMVSQIVHQLVMQTVWGDLDYLIIDLPPGTGDVQLTLCQILPITAAVIVTTPQHISFIDVVKGIEMFDTLKVPVIGAVENMSYFEDKDGHKSHPFGSGALDHLKNEFGFKNTLEIPLEGELSRCGDAGTPFTLTHKNHKITKLFKTFAKTIKSEIELIKTKGINLPKVSFDQDNGILIAASNNVPYYINAKRLRLECRSALNKDEFTGTPLVQPSDIPDDVYPLSMNPVGNYALGINWSDGHSSLYPYDQLLSLV